SSVHSASPCMTRTGSPYRVTISGSGSRCAPEAAQNCCPSRKSRLPRMTKQGTPCAVRDFKSAIAAACAASAASSPTHDSNRSPRMYSASALRASVRINSMNCSVMAGRVASMCRSDMKRIAMLRVAARSRSWNALDPFDDNRLHGRILLEGSLRSGRHVGDLVDHVHALHDLAEYGISPASLIRIERCVVVQIDVELHVAGVGFRRPRQPHAGALIGQPVPRFVDYLGWAALELVIGVVAAPLDHEIRNRAVKDGARIKPLID